MKYGAEGLLSGEDLFQDIFAYMSCSLFSDDVCIRKGSRVCTLLT